MPSAPPEARPSAAVAAPARALGEAALVWLAGWVLLAGVHLSHPLHDDTNEDLLLARLCAEQGRCHAIGVSTRFEGVEQGGLWVNLLAWLRGQGLSVDAIHTLMFGLAALGLSVIYLTLRRRGSPRLAVVTTGFTVIGMLSAGSLHVLWNPTLMPLPASLLMVGAVRIADTRRLAMSLPLGAALGLTLEIHPVAVLVVPGAMVAAGMVQRDRVRASVAPLVAGAVAFGLYAAFSPQAVYRNVQTAVAWLSPLWLAVALVVPAAVAVALSAVVSVRSAETRLVASALAIGLAPLVVVVAAGELLAPRYLLPAAPALALLAAFAVIEGRRRALSAAPSLAPKLRMVEGLAAIVGIPLLVVVWPLRENAELRLGAIETVSARLREEDGLTLDAAWARMSGPGCRDILGAMAALGASAEGTPAALPDESLAVVMAAALPAGASVDDLDRGRWRVIETPAGAVLVGALDTFVDRRHVTACREVAGGAPPECLEVDLGAGIASLLGRADRAAGAVPLMELETPRLVRSPEAEHADRPPTVRATYRVPVRVPAGASPRTVVVPGAERGCAVTRFTRIEGMPTPTELPSPSIELISTDEEQQGALSVEVDYRACGDDHVDLFPPCLSELEASDGPALRALLDPG